MGRQHGIASDTYEKLLLDTGVVRTNFVSFASPGTLLGATRGGAVFKREPQYKETPFEGIPGQVVGQKHLVNVKVSLMVNIISLDTTNIALAIPNSVVTSFDANYEQLTENEWDPAGEHTLTNIAIIAELSGKSIPVVIVLDNPICENDTTLSFKDKGESVAKWRFSAFYKESVGFASPPWRIFWPK